jgi:exonuclease SbcC
MLPRRLILRDFLSYVEADVDFAGSHIVALAGENGAGKSALAVDGLTWALWGESRARSDDDIVRQGADECSVTLTFEAGGSVYRVIRRRRLPKDGRAGTSALAFEVEGDGEKTRLTRETIRETQDLITGIVGMDYRTFINTACLVQGKADQFTTAGPGDRKQVLVSLLGLEAWQGWADVCHDRNRRATAEVEAADAAIGQARELLEAEPEIKAELAQAEADFAALFGDLDAAVAAEAEARELDAAQAELRQEIAHLKTEFGRLALDRRKAEQDIADLSSRIATAPTPAAIAGLQERAGALADSAALLMELEVAERRHATVMQQLDSLDQQRGSIGRQIVAETARIAAMPAEPTGLETCPTCGQEVKGEAHFRMVEKLTGDRAIAQAGLDRLTVERARMDEAHASADAERMALGPAPTPEAMAQARTAARDLVQARAELTKAEETARQLADLGPLLERRQADFAGLDEQLGTTEARLSAANLEIESQGDFHQRLIDVVARVQAAREAVDEARVHKGALQGRLEQLAEIALQAQATEKRRTSIAEAAATYGELEIAFGPRGVQAMLIDSAIPHIRDEANRLLALMSSGTTIDLTTQRVGKTTGKGIETLDIIIADPQGTRPYENYSGGERFRIDFSLRIALARLLARRAKAPCRVLIMDEGFGSQDGAGRTGLIEALTTVKGEFGLMLIISHIDELRELIPTTVTIAKTPAGSTASLS